MKKITITNQNFQILTMRGWLKLSVRGLQTLSNPPVKVYNNADLQKKQILIENKGKSGVYRWTNIVSGKTYVGSSVDLSQRFYKYYNVASLIRD